MAVDYEPGNVCTGAPATDQLVSAAPRALVRAGYGLLLVGMVWIVLVIAAITWFFLTQPGYVDHIDGLVLFHQMQAAAGKNIYDPVYREGPPYSIPVYGPVYYYLVGWLMGDAPSLLPGRLTSMASVLALGGLSWWFLRRRIGSPHLVAAVGAFAWLALKGPFEFAMTNRVDMLATSLGIAAVFAFAAVPRRGWLLAIPLLLLSGFTKPTFAVAPALAIFIELLLEQRHREAAAFSGLTLLAIVALFLFGDYWTAGNFSNCLLGTVAPMCWDGAKQMLRDASKQPLFLVGIGCALWLVRHKDARLFALHALAGFAVALATSAKLGSNLNYYLEACWAASFAVALTLSRLRGHPRFHIALAVAALLLLQAAGRITPHIQRQYGRVAAWPELVETVRRYGELGPVFTIHPGVQVLVGQKPSVTDPFLLACLTEQDRFDLTPILEDLSARRYAAVLLRTDIPRPKDCPRWSAQFVRALRTHYYMIHEIAEIGVFIPRTAPLDLPIAPSVESPLRQALTTFNANGQKLHEIELLHGVPNGFERVWDEQGQLLRQTGYSRGVKHGLEQTWYDNGRLASEVPYEQGQRHGRATFWYPTGQTWCANTYVRGVSEGPGRHGNLPRESASRPGADRAVRR